MPVLSSVPEDCEVMSVHHDPYRKAYGYLLWQAWFDVVPDGLEAPTIEAELQFVRFRRDEAAP